MQKISHYRYAAPVGVLHLAATDRGLRFLQFRDFDAMHEKTNWIESKSSLEPYLEQLRAYFDGQLRDFSFPLDLVGTDFQKKCWRALCRIPYGQTRTYADLAREVGSPKSFRAVGQANHRNPVAIVVPCHRVIGADGTLTGYGGGLHIKEMLLRLEGAVAVQQHVLKF